MLGSYHSYFTALGKIIQSQEGEFYVFRFSLPLDTPLLD